MFDFLVRGHGLPQLGKIEYGRQADQQHTADTQGHRPHAEKKRMELLASFGSQDGLLPCSGTQYILLSCMCVPAIVIFAAYHHLRSLRMVGAASLILDSIRFMPVQSTVFKTCDALRANNYFSGPQFGAAGAWVNLNLMFRWSHRFWCEQAQACLVITHTYR